MIEFAIRGDRVRRALKITTLRNRLRVIGMWKEIGWYPEQWLC
jgi:hypothetical protein